MLLADQQRELGAIAQFEQVQKARHSIADRLQTEVHLGGDLTIRKTLGDESDQFLVGGAQALEVDRSTIGDSATSLFDVVGGDELKASDEIDDRRYQMVARSVLDDERSGSGLVGANERLVRVESGQRDRSAVGVVLRDPAYERQAVLTGQSHVDDRDIGVVNELFFGGFDRGHGGADLEFVACREGEGERLGEHLVVVAHEDLDGARGRAHGPSPPDDESN